VPAPLAEPGTTAVVVSAFADQGDRTRSRSELSADRDRRRGNAGDHHCGQLYRRQGLRSDFYLVRAAADSILGLLPYATLTGRSAQTSRSR